MNLWLDDIREKPPEFDVHVYTAWDAIKMISSGKVDLISLDHDLGDDLKAGTGYDVAKFIEEQAHRGTVSRMEWRLHSANPVGIQKMQQALQSAERAWERNEEGIE